MVDLFAVRRRTGETTQNEETGREEPVLEEVFTTLGKLQMRGPSAGASESEMAGRTITVTTLEWHSPLSAPVAQNDDQVELIEAGAGTDPALEGVQVRIVAPVIKSYATARRYRVEES